MKVIGHTGGSKYLVEMTEDEMAVAAGYRSTYDENWKRVRLLLARHESQIPAGAVVDVHAIQRFNNDIGAKEDEVLRCANTMRGLATLLEGNVPSRFFIPPRKCEHCEDGWKTIADATESGNCPKCGLDLIPF